jgi:hypothetical protein
MIKTVEILSLNDETQYFSFNTESNLDNIKKKLKDERGINIIEQLWFINGNTLTYNTEIKDNDDICVIVDNKWIELKLNFFNDKKLKLPLVTSDITVYELKLVIFSLEKKLLPTQINLIYKNNTLEDSKKISDYKIVNKTTLNVTLNIKSGFL